MNMRKISKSSAIPLGCTVYICIGGDYSLNHFGV